VAVYAGGTMKSVLLLVEDNLRDTRLIQEALLGHHATIIFAVVRDGPAALDYLGAVGPDLVLLDLRLPKKSGHEVLAALKSAPNLKTIPVLLLTRSPAEEVVRAYDLAANSYLVKPSDGDDLDTLGQGLEALWFRASLPTHN
jgi:CheY-like chemotaxis protein